MKLFEIMAKWMLLALAGLFLLGLTLFIAILAQDKWKSMRAQPLIELHNERLEDIRATPAYARLLAHGGEICPDQAEQFVWACGATLRLPFSSKFMPHRRLCSSAAAPEFVGYFKLPNVLSMHPETEGEPADLALIKKGYFINTFDARFERPLSAFAVCKEHTCPGPYISINGGAGFVREVFWEGPRNVQHVDQVALALPPLAEATANHWVEWDAHIAWEGTLVAYRAYQRLSDVPPKCQFSAVHPDYGYRVTLLDDCKNIADWRQDLSGVFAALSERTVAYDPAAQCSIPPMNARIRRGVSVYDIDENQSLRDWAVAREAAHSNAKGD